MPQGTADLRATRSVMLWSLQGRDDCWSTGHWRSGGQAFPQEVPCSGKPCAGCLLCLLCHVSSVAFLKGSKLRRKHQLCPLSAVFPHLVKELNTGLHVTILLLLFLALALALVSMGFAVLNVVQVPYRAVNGPGGICLWNVLAGKTPRGDRSSRPHCHQAGSTSLGEKSGGISVSAFSLQLSLGGQECPLY